MRFEAILYGHFEDAIFFVVDKVSCYLPHFIMVLLWAFVLQRNRNKFMQTLIAEYIGDCEIRTNPFKNDGIKTKVTMDMGKSRITNAMDVGINDEMMNETCNIVETNVMVFN